MSSTHPRHLYGTGYTAGKANSTDAYLWQPVLRQLAPLPAGGRVLDAGCGNGFFAKQLREKGFDVVGMDLEESGVAHARNLMSLFAFAQFVSSPHSALYWKFPVLNRPFGPFICRNHFPYYVSMCFGLGGALLWATRGDSGGRCPAAAVPAPANRAPRPCRGPIIS